uniref:Bestrophin homolog n=1 Tax=Leptocylindrus danicus TaxID=163516 RepID=A0A7S2PDQ7_9STRA
MHRSLLILNQAKFASMMCMSKLPHSLLVSSLGLLLVFKTNSAYGRFQEGRQIWERIQSKSRDLTRMMALYQHDMTAPRKERVQNLLAAFPYLLRHHINPRCMSKEQLDAVPDPHKLQLEDEVFPIDTRFEDSVRSMDPANNYACSSHRHCTVDKRALPWRLLPAKSLNHIAKSRNRALWVCDRMSAEIASIPYTNTWQNRERLTMLQHVNELSRAIGECERIHQTLVPINYARHCLRSLTLWLLSLPFALLDDLGLKTGVVMMVLSWLMFGVYQIGYSIEDPFQGSIRLSIICDNIRREVLLESENGLRYTAFDDCPIENDADTGDPSSVMNAMNSEDSQQHVLMDDASSDGNNAGDYAYAPVQ